MDDLHYNWTLIYIVILAIACVTMVVMLCISFRHLNVQESAVQYITMSLCRSYFLYSLSRLVFYMLVLVNFDGLRDLMDTFSNGQMMGVRMVYYDENSLNKALPMGIALLGDVALLSATFWVIQMAYELTRLILRSMDRGKERERLVVSIYFWRTYGASFLFGAMMMASALLSPEKEGQVRTICLAIQLACVWFSFLYPLYCASRISVRKHVRMRVVDPASLLLHQRMKNLVRVYCVLVFPACVVELLVRGIYDVPELWIGVCQALYYMSGAAATLVIGTSVSCCYRTLRPMMPDSIYEQLLEQGFFNEDGAMRAPGAEPPISRPIFVCTDIEGSTNLWSKEPHGMSTAQSLHDDLLRRELTRFNGYEITTCGDAFQLAFHRVEDALGWCLSVQQKLLKVHWPSALLAHDSSARVYDIWGRLIFNGLRVRMAIHDGDAQLICSKHPTTGKMTYMGISEIVAREMGDMGNGGQILISETALQQYEQEEQQTDSKLHGTFFYRNYDTFDRPELDINVQLFEIFSTALGDRYRKEKETRTELANARLVLLRHH